MFELDNCWRVLLYSETDTYKNYLNDFGLPICLKDKQIFPNEGIKISFLDLMNNPINELFSIFRFCTLALGIPYDISFKILLEEFNIVT